MFISDRRIGCILGIGRNTRLLMTRLVSSSLEIAKLGRKGGKGQFSSKMTGLYAAASGGGGGDRVGVKGSNVGIGVWQSSCIFNKKVDCRTNMKSSSCTMID